MAKKKKEKQPTILKPRLQPAPAPNLTREQVILGEMFGGGNGAILPGDGSCLPKINNDLNPRQRGDDTTANIFGFGGRGERSGLF